MIEPPSEINLLNRNETGIVLSQTSSSISSQSSPISNSSSSSSTSASLSLENAAEREKEKTANEEDDDDFTDDSCAKTAPKIDDKQTILNKLLIPSNSSSKTSSSMSNYAKSPSIMDDYTSVRVAIR